MGLEMSTLKLTPAQWDLIKEKVYEGTPISVRLLKARHKEYFGFIVRHHEHFEKRKKDTFVPSAGMSLGELVAFQSDWKHEQWVCLDFYDEAAATMFRLKWL